jgi:fucose 4-O-acetylase-like acetyltransferase
MLSVRLCRKWDFGIALLIAVGSFVYSRYYHVILSSAVGWQVYAIKLLGFLSVVVWRYYLFFYLGAWVRRHFEAFVRWTDKPAVIALITGIFAFVASTPHRDHLLYEILRLYVGGISGMWMVFCFFRLSASWLQRIRLSKPLQYVGTRTLDIYMLHYFFLPRFLLAYADQLQAFDSSVMEFVVILCISLLVLGVTLLTSYIIRLSPFLGHYLFGVDYRKT